MIDQSPGESRTRQGSFDMELAPGAILQPSRSSGTGYVHAPKVFALLSYS